MSKLFVIVSLVFLGSAFVAKAGILPEVTVEGIVINFDAENVELFNEGKITKVSRKNIPDYLKVTPGARIFAVLDSKSVKEQLAVK